MDGQRQSVAQRMGDRAEVGGGLTWEVEDDPNDDRRQMLRWHGALIAEVYPHRDGGWQWIVWLGETRGGRVPETVDPWYSVWSVLWQMDGAALDEVALEWKGTP